MSQSWTIAQKNNIKWIKAALQRPTLTAKGRQRLYRLLFSSQKAIGGGNSWKPYRLWRAKNAGWRWSASRRRYVW